jgi:hypothetical protein
MCELCNVQNFEAQQHADELDHMSDQMDAYPLYAADWLAEHHTDVVAEQLCRFLDGLTSDMGWALPRPEASAAVDAAVLSLKHAMHMVKKSENE